MPEVVAFLWGFSMTLAVESVVLMFVTDWLRKKAKKDGKRKAEC